jgi:hypothetical protein
MYEWQKRTERMTPEQEQRLIELVSIVDEVNEDGTYPVYTDPTKPERSH